MTETVVATNALQAVLSHLIPTEKVCVKEDHGIVQLVPVKESVDCTIGLRGILADCPEMSVDKFLARKRAEKDSEL